MAEPDRPLSPGMQEQLELGYVFGTFLGDGTSFLNWNGMSEIGRVTWNFGPSEHATARKLVDCLEAVSGVPAAIISTGSDRDDTIVRSEITQRTLGTGCSRQPIAREATPETPVKLPASHPHLQWATSCC